MSKFDFNVEDTAASAVVDLYKKGEPIKEIVRVTGVSTYKIYKMLNDANVTLRGAGGHNRIERAKTEDKLNKPMVNTNQNKLIIDMVELGKKLPEGKGIVISLKDGKVVTNVTEVN